MGRLDQFNVSIKDFQKYGIKIDFETGLELATEYEKLCKIRDSRGRIEYSKCQNCANLNFSFNQETYQINYFCTKNKEISITIDNIQESRLCMDFDKKEDKG